MRMLGSVTVRWLALLAAWHDLAQRRAERA